MTYTFCEPVTATVTSRIHIRQTDTDGPKLGGGIVGSALCGADLERGWDLETVVDSWTVGSREGAHVNPVCPVCVTRWRSR